MIKFELSAFYDNDLAYINFNNFMNENNIKLLNSEYLIIYQNDKYRNENYYKKSELSKLKKI